MPAMPGSAPLLLLSMPQMADPNFSRTVVLLCDYTTEGAFGLVVNRQMAEPAWTMVKTEPPITVDRALRLWLGGPVDPQKTWVLMADVDPQLIFGVPADEMWETAIRRLGADPAALQMSPGVH